MLRWLLLIPFALLVAIGVGTLVVLGVAAVSSAAWAVLLQVVGWLMLPMSEMAEKARDPMTAVIAASRFYTWLRLSVFVFPASFMAVMSEVGKRDGFIFQSTVSGILTVILVSIHRISFGYSWVDDPLVIGSLFLFGAIIGGVYWAIAGRNAGGQKPLSSVKSAPLAIQREKF
jgi:hypothetical protein